MEKEEIFLPYRCVLEGGEGEIVEKKSRFIASVCKAESEEEAVAFIEKQKKKYWDASHNCSAFVIGRRAQLSRCSDDGEPSGTAGRPMLEVLLKEEICNVVVVVTRYFGGTLLGTGGLVRAYGAAVKAGLENSVVATMRYGSSIRITTDYTDVGRIQYLLGKRGDPFTGCGVYRSGDHAGLHSRRGRRGILQGVGGGHRREGTAGDGWKSVLC